MRTSNGIVSYGGTVTLSGVAVGDGATIVINGNEPPEVIDGDEDE